MSAESETLDGGVEETEHDGEQLPSDPRELLTLVVTAIGQRWSGKRYDDTQQLREAALSKGELKPLVSALEYVEGIKGATVDVAGLLEPNIRFMDSDRNFSSVHVVCALGNLDALKAFKEKCGVDPREAKPDKCWKWSPLHEAADGGHGEVVAYLVECGLDHCEKAGSMTPRDLASFEGHNSVAYMLEKMDRESFRRGAGKTAGADLRMGTVLKPRHEMTHDNDTQDARIIVGHIASGTFGDVYKVINNRTGTEEAVKIVKEVVKTDKLGTQQRDAKFIRLLKSQLDEANTMLKLGLHRNIVSIRGVELLRNVLDTDGTTLTDNLYVYMDYVSGGRTLTMCILRVALTYGDVVRLLYDVAQGLRHVESKKLTYWDLKPDNVLVECEDVDGRLRPIKAMICDFGESCTTFFASKETLAFFRAPSDDPTREQLKESAKKTQHLWSWGTTTLEVLRVYLKLGDQWKDHRDVIAMFQSYTIPRPHGTPLVTCFELCRSCLHRDPTCSVQNIVDTLSAIVLGDLMDSEPVPERDQMELCELHTDLGTAYFRDLTQSTCDYEDAATHLKAARDIAIKLQGPESPLFATALNNLAELLSAQGKYDEAKPLYDRSLGIREKTLGKDHPAVAQSLNNLAGLLCSQGKYDEAKPLYERSFGIREKTLGKDHPAVAESLNNLAQLLSAQGKYDEAKPLYERAIEIGEKTVGPNHPAVATRLNNLAGLLKAQGKYDEAKLLTERAIEIGEKTLGPNHPSLNSSLNNLAGLLKEQGKYDEALPLFRRAIEIGERALGPNHPNLAASRNNLAGLLESQGKYGEAIMHFENAAASYASSLGEEHELAVAVRRNLARCRTAQDKSRTEQDSPNEFRATDEEETVDPTYPEPCTTEKLELHALANKAQARLSPMVSGSSMSPNSETAADGGAVERGGQMETPLSSRTFSCRKQAITELEKGVVLGVVRQQRVIAACLIAAIGRSARASAKKDDTATDRHGEAGDLSALAPLIEALERLETGASLEAEKLPVLTSLNEALGAVVKIRLEAEKLPVLTPLNEALGALRPEAVKIRLEATVRALSPLIDALKALIEALERLENWASLEAVELPVLALRVEVAKTGLEATVRALSPLIKALKALQNGTELEAEDARALLAANESPDAITIDRGSWLHHVCRVGTKDSVVAVLALLRRSGVNPCRVEADLLGNSPMHVAAGRGDLEIVKVLLDNGFDYLAKNYCDYLPREMASMECHSDVKFFLDDASVERYLQPRLPDGMEIKSSHDGGADTARVVIGFVARGSFGDVYKVINKKTGQYEAVKVVRKVTRLYHSNYSRASTHALEAKYLDRLKRHLVEARAMLQIGLHPNIVSIRGISLLRNVRDESGEAMVDSLYVFMEYVDGGKTLKDCIKKLDSSHIETVVGLLLDIATGLAYLESKGVTHWDLKPANILIEYGGDPPGPVRAKLTDFGEAFTRQYASKETLAAFKQGATDDTKRAAAKTQHQWSWATTVLAVFSSLFGWKDDWEDYNEAMAVLAIRLAQADPGTLLHKCLLLCQYCMYSDPHERTCIEIVVSELTKELSKTPRESVVATMKRNPEELFDLHTELGRVLIEEVASSAEERKQSLKHFQKAKKLAVERWGEDSMEHAIALNNLAAVLHSQGENEKALEMCYRAIKIAENIQGSNHLTFIVKNSLALLLRAEENFDEAKSLYERAIEIGKETLGPDHPELAIPLNNLAGLLTAQGKHDEAIPLYDRAIDIREKTLGPDHPMIAISLNGKALLLYHQGKYDEAKPLYERAIEIGENTLGRDHPFLATRRINFAELLIAQGKYDEAKPLYDWAIEIYKNALGPDHPVLATALNRARLLTTAQGKRTEAKSLSIETGKTTLGPSRPDVAHDHHHEALTLLSAPMALTHLQIFCTRSRLVYW